VEIIEEVKTWIENFVIGLNLCPFAKVPFEANNIVYKLAPIEEHKVFLSVLEEELRSLQNQKHATTVIIIPNKAFGFRSYLDLYDSCVALITSLELEEDFQLASFHPDYQFADAAPDDQSNFTNRSPYPLVHILRVEALAAAIESYGDTASIYKRNIELLNSLSREELEGYLSK